ncbi:OLC1v1026949C1 [Oldenlandia corymbosa var. corymbosa]|uniref:OLC1v1026949C1 n=1 Tax=Oldenlandia corymbosa var. corymbosa TaxID=529605 RepID=A0AAV1C8B8_OLDCO|nr:OLC1v1026949C1 [Oldenlandia corymbosa var. corymbosa]
MGMMELIGKARIEAFMSCFVRVHPHETSALFYSTSTFFFILSAYFLVLPLRDEGAISLGLGNLPELFVGSLLLTLVAAPLSTLIFSLPNLSKRKALVFIHRFFSASLVVFFILFLTSSPGTAGFNFKGLLRMSSTIKEELKVEVNHASAPSPDEWSNNGWFYKAVRICLFLWVALLNLITISSTWARVIDVMDTESGSRLFGFIGAGATFGQLCGSVLATIVAWLGPYLLLFAAILMELAAQSAKGIERDTTNLPDEQLPMRKVDSDDHLDVADEHSQRASGRPSPKSSAVESKPQFWSILDGIRLILSSTYLIYVALFLWLSAVVSSFFYFQKVTVIATSVTNPVQRRRLFAQINSFIAVFILGGQLTVTGRILTIFGVTAAISCTPFVAIINLIAIALWPTWIAVAICETLRKVTTYVVTRPGRELLFTVVSQEEKYKAKVCIDVIVQRLGDASAAGMYKLLHTTVKGNPSTASLYALPVCMLWILTAFHLGHRQVKLAKLRSSQPPETIS